MPEPSVTEKLTGLVLEEIEQSPGKKTETRSFERKIGELVADYRYFDRTKWDPVEQEYAALLRAEKTIDVPAVLEQIAQQAAGKKSAVAPAFSHDDLAKLGEDIRFSALYALCMRARLDNQIDEYENWLKEAEKWKWAAERGSFHHLWAMLLSTRQQPLTRDLEYAWRNAEEACRKVPGHSGFLHNRAEIAAKQAEQIQGEKIEEPVSGRVAIGLADLLEITSKERYAKFWATRARLELLQMKYEDAEKSAFTALRLECGRWDSHYRRADYTALLYQIRFRKGKDRLDQALTEVKSKAVEIHEEIKKQGTLIDKQVIEMQKYLIGAQDTMRDKIDEKASTTEEKLKATENRIEERARENQKNLTDYVESTKTRHIEILAFFVTLVTLLAGGMQTIIGAARPASNTATTNATTAVATALGAPETVAVITALCMLVGTLLIAFAGLGWLLRTEVPAATTRSLALVFLGAFVFCLALLGRTVSANEWMVTPLGKITSASAAAGMAIVCAIAGCILAAVATWNIASKEKAKKNIAAPTTGPT